MARALSMARLKLFEAEHALSARRRMRCGGTAHAAQPDDDHIERRHVAKVRIRPSSIAGAGCHTVLFVIFVASGCAALIYEMVWFHLVQLVVGASSISVAVLLCSFMGGMALGSWFIPRLVPAAVSPLRAVAALEAGIGDPGHPDSVPPAVRAAGVCRDCRLRLRRGVAQGRRMRADPDAANDVDGRHAANDRADARRRCRAASTPPTSPAAPHGTVIAGFYLLRVHDVFVASGVAIAINVVVAASRVAVVATAPWHVSHAPFGTFGTRGTIGTDLRAGFRRVLSGFTALGAEVVWTRQLSLLFRRQRLYVLADPRGVSRRPRHRRRRSARALPDAHASRQSCSAASSSGWRSPLPRARG